MGLALCDFETPSAKDAFFSSYFRRLELLICLIYGFDGFLPSMSMLAMLVSMKLDYVVNVIFGLKDVPVVPSASGSSCIDPLPIESLG